ncbi:hypothetical protein E5329_19615 [Petralouisia muris]|uniref:Uncharacterized protein n=1 Tax=Petralouisia muris TaxID=3032872 RepID=A0AC61RT10_9FIRM|nr:hypothetical protein [Petralouisia muris]TGY91991.1 hypothetical protein E5329_19615 [Petralouisia muris]
MKEDIKWCDLRITIPYVMGQLSEKKLSAIIENLRESQFKNAKLIMSELHVAAISLVNGKKNLLIEPQQITFASHLEDGFDIEAIQLQFSTVLNALLIDDENQYLVNIEGISDTDNSHAESKQFFEEKFMPLDDDICGVGYRFLVNSGELFGEFKIEPLVSDVGKYYYQWVLNKSEKGTIEDMLHDVQSNMDKERDGCYSVIRR